jgi:hypothetical protein
VLVCYVRALRAHGWQGVLDVAFSDALPTPLEQELLNFAKARARKHGCRQLVAWPRDTHDRGCLTALTRGGFHPVGDVLSCEL